MLEALISSRTRINLLLKFFINPEHTAYLRGLADEFNESTNAIRLELNRFERAGMLDTAQKGNRKIFKANQKHPLFSEVRSIILKHTGIDGIVEHVVKKMGNPEKVYLTGDFAQGRNADIIDLVIVGKEIDKNYLLNLIEKAEQLVNKRVRYITYENGEFNPEALNGEKDKFVLLWSR